jgi:hypothetical protein
MKIKYYSLPELMEDMKSEGIKTAHIQSVQYRQNVPYTGGINVPHTFFEIIVSARKEDSVMEYVNRTFILADGEDKRRLNKAIEKTETLEASMTKILQEKGFEIRKGRYE